MSAWSVQPKLEEEIFPPLQTRKQNDGNRTSRRSSVSSVSSTSVCGYYAETNADPMKCHPWFKEVVRRTVCRRRMFCKCNKCAKNQKLGLLKKKQWNSLSKYPCEEAVRLHKGDQVKLINLKNYGKNGEPMVFVCVYDPTVLGEVYVTREGWVHPESLGGLEAVRLALQKKEAAQNVHAARKMFRKARMTQRQFRPVANRTVNVAPAPLHVAPAPVPPRSLYEFKELVLVREALGHPWFQAEVVQAYPLKVKCTGRILSPDKRNVKKHPTSKFVAVQNVAVRSQEHPNAFVKKTLPKGTVLHVVQMNGFHARITSPICGWVQMRSVHELFALEENYQFQQVEERLFLGGLPLNTTSSQVKAALKNIQTRRTVMVTNIQFFTSGEKLCAYLKLWGPADYKEVAGKKINVKGAEVSCEFCLAHLRCKAAQR